LKDIEEAKIEAKEDSFRKESEDFMAGVVFGQRDSPNMFKSSSR
jgi:hypothetical protein